MAENRVERELRIRVDACPMQPSLGWLRLPGGDRRAAHRELKVQIHP